MKRFLLLTHVLLFSIASWGQTPFTATYTFGSDGNVTSFVYNGTVYDGIALSNIEKVVVTSSSSSGNFRASNWPTGATTDSDVFTGTIDAAKYVGFTISAVEGYKFTVSSITFGIGRSMTGTRQSEWRGSADSYAATINNYTSLNAGLTNSSGVLTNPDANSYWTGNVLGPGASYTDVSTSVGFRLYLFNSETTAGTAGLQGPITISGTFELTDPVPSLNISSSSSLTESNLNNSQITLTLSNETFVASLQSSYFTLNNAPAGTSIQSVSRVNDTETNITLAFDGTNFDEDINNFNITASADALSGADAINSNNLSIKALPTLLISEVAHPSNAASAKFVELYNYGSKSIDLSALSISIARQTNGGTINSVLLTSTIDPYSSFVIAGSEAAYMNYFSKAADSYSGTIDGNGNDAYFLYVEGNHSTGTLFDAYGVMNEDGTEKPWEYTNSKAVRKITVTAPSSTWTASEWVIVSSTTERMSPGLYPATVWNGSADNNWGEASNWDNGVPASTTDFVIWGGASNFPELTTETTVRNFVFTHDAQLNGQENLTVSGSITVLHQLEFSDEHENLNRWQYFTSPFTNLTSGGMLSSNDRVDLYLTAYDNSISASINESWNWLSSTATSITPGIGYAATAVNDITESGTNISTSYYCMTTSGTLVNTATSVTVNLQYQGVDQNNWNLTGNPYLAPINWFDNSNLDYSKIQGNAAYLYNPANSTYITLTGDGTGSGTIAPSGTQYIPPLQGFFVQALSAGSFEISQAARVNNKQTFYKSESLMPILRLSASVDSLYDETVIIFNEMASKGFDPYDANKLISNSKSPQIYTTPESGHKLVFNQTPSLESNIDVQLVANTTGRYTLSLNEIGALFNDYNITLTDHSRKQSTTLSSSDYQFDVEEANRVFDFTLNFQERTSIDASDLIDLKVYAIKDQVIIQSGYNHTGMITIFDAKGKKILDQSVSGLYSSIEMSARGGLFIVRLNGTKGTTHHKVFINL